MVIHFYNGTGMAPEKNDIIEKAKKHDYFALSVIFFFAQSAF